MDTDGLGRRARQGGESSDEEHAPAPKRQKRHKFKNFAARVKDVDVDVYRSLGPKRAEPLPGSTSFFQEKLNAWRELNAAHDWLEAAAALHPLSQSLPQLLHHQSQIIDIILSRLTMEASLSLEPLMEMLGTLARDLQEDYLPHLPRIFAHLSSLVESGADREPELLQHVFTGCSLINKHLVKLLVDDHQQHTTTIATVLSLSSPLRYHRAPHVRVLAAQTFGFLLRHASTQGMRSALRAVLADAVVKPSVARLHGTGLLVAEAVMGVGNGLHSKGIALLGLLLQSDILTVVDFHLTTPSSTSLPKKIEKGKKGTNNKKQAPIGIDEQTIEARVGAVTGQCLDRLLNHVRRGTDVVPLWDVVIDAVLSRLDGYLVQRGCDGGGGGGGSVDAGERVEKKKNELARGVALISRMVEYHRGSRVQTYDPLFKLAARLVASNVVVASTSASTNKSKENSHSDANDKDEDKHHASEYEAMISEFLHPSLSSHILRLLIALVRSHCKAVSASEGPIAIERAAPLWSGMFSRAPQHEIVVFVHQLLSPPATPQVARPFLPHMLAAVGRQLLAAEAVEKTATRTTAIEENSDRNNASWPLLVDMCAIFSQTQAGSFVPIILTAGGGMGPKLAQFVILTVKKWKKSIDATTTTKKGSNRIALTWAAVQCLPHAVAKPSQVLDILKESGLLSFDMSDRASSTDDGYLVILYSSVVATAATAATSLQSNVRQELVSTILDMVRKYPTNYHAISSAAAVVSQLSPSSSSSSQHHHHLAPDATQFESILRSVEQNLSDPSAALRRSTLQLLCAFPQSFSVAQNNEKEEGTKDVFSHLLSIYSHELGADGGRPPVVALGRVKHSLEYNRVPPLLVPAVVRSLLGVLYLRFAPVWPAAASCIACAVDQYPTVAWPFVFDRLKEAQTEFLSGGSGSGSGSGTLSTRGGVVSGSPLNKDESLDGRFKRMASEGTVEASGGSSDASTRLMHLLRSLATTNHSVVEAKFRDWIPLFLAYSSAKGSDGSITGGGGSREHDDEGDDIDDEEEEEEEKEDNSTKQTRRVSPKAWRVSLREWLDMLSTMKGIRGVALSTTVQHSIATHVMDVDCLVQQAALKCMKVFKLPWFNPYVDKLLRLADAKTLRSELAAFPLSPNPTSTRKGDDIQVVLPEHRSHLIPLLISLLFPKMRKRSGRLGGKGAPGSARSAILNFLAAAEPEELRYLLELFLGPMKDVFGSNGTGPDVWHSQLGQRSGQYWLDAIDSKVLNLQPLRRRIGYLNTMEDVLNHLGHRIERYLPELIAIAVFLFEGVVVVQDPHAQQQEEELQGEEEEEEEEEDSGRHRREIRSRCIRLIATALDRFPSSIDYSFVWPRLLPAAAPLMERIGIECSADKPPPLVELCVTMSMAPSLVGILADGMLTMTSSSDFASKGVGVAGDAMGTDDDDGHDTSNNDVSSTFTFQPNVSEEWAIHKLGSRLFGRCIGALSSPACAEPTRVAVLGALEHVFELPDPLPETIIGAHIPLILNGLQSVVIAVWKQQYQKGRQRSNNNNKNRQGHKASSSGGSIPRRVTATRALAILELVGGRANDWKTAAQLTDALLPLLSPSSSSSKRSTKDEELIARAMGALRALWNRLGEASTAISTESRAPQAQEERLMAMASAVAPLTGALSSRPARSMLCALYASIAAFVPPLQPSSSILTSLNSYSTTDIDEFDYDERMRGYLALTPEAWRQFTTTIAVAPLIQQCARDLRNPDDLALRHAAAQALSQLIDSSSADSGSGSDEKEGEQQGGGKKKNTRKKGSTHSTATTVETVVIPSIQRVLFPQLKKSVGDPSLAVRQEHLTLIRKLAITLPTHYPDLQTLTHEDAEADIWLNVVHLQLHRRARGFARLTKMLSVTGASAGPGAAEAGAPDEVGHATSASISIGVMVGLIAPMLQQVIIESKSTSGDEGLVAGHEVKQIDVDKGANVVDAAVGCLGALARVLPWIQYKQLLGQYLRLMKKHSGEEGSSSKAVLRAVCAILDNFHFDIAMVVVEEAVVVEEEVEEDDDSDEDDGIVVQEELLLLEKQRQQQKAKDEAEEKKEILRMLSQRVVPELRAHVVAGEKVRASVALALVKVLKLLPDQLMRLELPRTLQTVANLLRLRLQRLRDDARSVLVAMAKDLGPEYLQFTIEVLRSALPDRGFTAHVLGYTVHAVMDGIAPMARHDPTAIDDCLLMVLPMIDNDLFGHVAEAKEVDAFASSYKEAKRCRANDTYQILASLVTFKSQIPVLLSLVRNKLPEASNPKVRSKVAALLQSASVGLLANPTATAQDVCELVYAIVTTGLDAEEAAREKAGAASGAATIGNSNSTAGTLPLPPQAYQHQKEREQGTGSSLYRQKKRDAVQIQQMETARVALHQSLLVEFALTTLKAALKKGTIPLQGKRAHAMLLPLYPLLIRALRSRHAPSVTAALQALSSIIVHADDDVFALSATLAGEAGKAVTDLLKHCPKTTHPVAQDCFKLLSGMLRRCEEYAPSNAQLRFLLGWSFTDLEEGAQRQTAFTLLRAILARKLMLPEVYDLMERVQELIVRSQSSQIRQLAASSLLVFLLDYPLSPQRLQSHVQFLLTNTSYEHESGRESALHMLSTILLKFPEEVINNWAEMLFLPLVVRLVNDPSSKCRELCSQCIAQLLSRLLLDRRDLVWKYCIQWLNGDGRLVRASAQVMGVFIEVEKEKQSGGSGRKGNDGGVVCRRVKDGAVVVTVASILQRHRHLHTQGRDDVEDSNNNNNTDTWQEAYYCLVLLEKILHIAPTMLSLSSSSDSPSSPATHGCWSAMCLLLLHPHAWVRKASARLLGAGLAAPHVGPPLLAQGGDAFPGQLALSFFRQLDSPVADEGMAGQAVKCLVFLSLFMYESDEKRGRVPLWRSTHHVRRSGNGGNGSVQGGEEEEEEGEEEEEEEEEEEAMMNSSNETDSLSLAALIRRMTRVADDKSYVRQLQRGTALRFIAAVTSRLGPQRIEPYLPLLLRPLYRLTEPGSTGNNPETKTLGDEILAHLRTVVGADVLLAGYGAARSAVRRQRGERKRQAAVQTLVDPEAAAKRKIRTAERKKKGKKRAMEEVRRMRGAGVVVKNKKGIGNGGGGGARSGGGGNSRW